MAGVFASDRGLANEWVTGLLSSDQAIAEMGIQLDRRFRDDFLERRLALERSRRPDAGVLGNGSTGEEDEKERA